MIYKKNAAAEGDIGQSQVPTPITPAQTRPLRHAVLRPHQPAEELVYPGDDEPTTFHLGVRDEAGGLIAIASFYNRPIPGSTEPAWQIRGMATLPEHRGKGHGQRLVEAGLALARKTHPGPVWCNARLVATGFYEKLGFCRHGEEFEIPDIGPHVVMVQKA